MIILVGASATGKTEVGLALKRIYGINKVVTYTTRSSRPMEKDGVDYNFISKEEFLALDHKEFFFETIKYNDNYYGTAKDSLNDDAYLILEPNGFLKYIESNYDIETFYLYTDEKTRYNRMIFRGDKEENAAKRIEIDRSIFDDDKLKCLAKHSIDVTHKTIDELARIVYTLSHKA